MSSGLTPRNAVKTEGSFDFTSPYHERVKECLGNISSKGSNRICQIDSLKDSCNHLLCKPCVLKGISASENDLEINLKATLAETKSVAEHAVIVDFLSRFKRRHNKSYIRKQRKMMESSAIILNDKTVGIAAHCSYQCCGNDRHSVEITPPRP